MRPLLVLALVTLLDLRYGTFGWSWLAGPVAALALYAFERAMQRPESTTRTAPGTAPIAAESSASQA